MMNWLLGVMRHLQQRFYLLHTHYAIVGTVLAMVARFYAGDLANGGKDSNYQRIKLMEESAVPSIVNPKLRMEPASVVLQQCRVMFVRKFES
jgi:hypothetical protein